MSGIRYLLSGLAIASPPGRAEPEDPLAALPSQWVRYDGARIHYKRVGSGEVALVFVHGWACDLTSWRRQLAARPPGTHAVFLDLPGFGQSDRPDRAYGMRYLAGAIESVRAAVGASRLVLIGHSMGTPVIREYYRAHPDRVAAMVPVDGTLKGVGLDSAATKRFLAMWEEPAFAANIDRMFEGMFGPASDSAVKAQVKRVAAGTSPRVALSAMRGMLDPAIWREDAIEVPVLAIMSDNPSWNREYVAFVERLAPRLRFETVARSGHFLMLERSAEFNALLLRFLRAERLVR